MGKAQAPKSQSLFDRGLSLLGLGEEATPAPSTSSLLSSQIANLAQEVVLEARRPAGQRRTGGALGMYWQAESTRVCELFGVFEEHGSAKLIEGMEMTFGVQRAIAEAAFADTVAPGADDQARRADDMAAFDAMPVTPAANRRAAHPR